jgi:bla regulator protein blaR1
MDAVLNWLWQGYVVAAAAFVMLRVLDRAHANVRYVVCWAALLLIVALPALPSLQPAPPAHVYLSARSTPMVSLPESWWTSTIVMLSGWMIWTAVCTIRFGSATLALRRARACARPFPSGVESALPHWSRLRDGRRATLVLSDAVTTAAVLPWGAPMIAVAPSLVTSLNHTELDGVLIHEWAHVQRRDDLVSTLQVVVRIIAGWHPAVWWIDRRLHIEREIACDEMTVAITGSPKSYAECLMKLASLKGTARPMQGAPAVLTMSGLRARITKILSRHPSIAPAWSRGLAAAMVSTLCAISVAVAGLELVEAAAFALPVPPTRMLTTTLEKLAPPVMPAAALQVESKRSPRPATVSARATQRTTEQQSPPPPSTRPDPKPDAPMPSEPVTVGQPTPLPAVEPAGGSVAPDTATVEPKPESQPPAAKPEQPRSPWGAAADGGVAIGRKSKEAGVATAGFFSHFARRVAGSF